jgi:hypothetical protein
MRQLAKEHPGFMLLTGLALIAFSRLSKDEQDVAIKNIQEKLQHVVSQEMIAIAEKIIREESKQTVQ